jgi:predicted Zn-dependent protease
MVHSLVVLERWRECLDVGIPLLEVCPELLHREDFMFNVGLAQAGVGHYHTALETLESLHSGRENDYNLNKVLGLVHVCLKNPRRALAHLQKANVLQPADPLVQRLIAELLNGQKYSAKL